MPTDPCTPLKKLLASGSPESATWLQIALTACRESLTKIDSMIDTLDADDRDLRACLEAVRNSLQWVIDQPASASQVSRTMVRAVKIFDSVATLETC